MSDPKPLDFSKVAASPPKPVSSIPKPLNFGSVVAPVKKPVPIATPVAPTPAVKVLDFSHAPPAVHHAPVPVARPMFVERADPSDSRAPDAMKLAGAKFPDLVRQNRDKVELQIRQLLPLKVDVVLEWGDKPLGYASQQSGAVTKISREISTSNTNSVIQHALNATQNNPNALMRMLGRDDAVAFKPRLSVVSSNINRWLPTIATTINELEVTKTKLMVNLASLVAVVDMVGAIPDDELDRVIASRRMILNQASTQAELSIASCKELRRQLIEMKATVDTLVNVTIPAYESAKR